MYICMYKYNYMYTFHTYGLEVISVYIWQLFVVRSQELDYTLHNLED